MNIYGQMAERIIQQQEGIIGPIALEQAKKVRGLQVDWSKKEVTFQGDEKEVLGRLVEQYKGLFGQASVEACKEAVKGLKEDVQVDQLPKSLQ
jgi:hypothetical protein